MLKKLLIAFMLLFSFIAGAIMFAWKPLLLEVVNGALHSTLHSSEDAPRIEILAFDGLQISVNELVLQRLELSIDGQLQRMAGLRLRGNFSAGILESMVIETLYLDLASLESAPPSSGGRHTAQQRNYSVAFIKTQISEALAQLGSAFELRIEALHIRQFPLIAPIGLLVQSDGETSVDAQLSLQPLRLSAQLALEDQHLSFQTSLQQETVDQGMVALWHLKNSCADDQQLTRCQLTSAFNLQNIHGLLLVLAHFPEFKTDDPMATHIHQLEQALERSEGVWTLQLDLALPHQAQSIVDVTADLQLSAEQPASLLLPASLASAGVQRIRLEQLAPLGLRWQDGALLQPQNYALSLQLIDEQQIPLTLTLTAAGSSCDVEGVCAGSVSLQSHLSAKQLRQHRLLSEPLAGIVAQSLVISSALNWHLDNATQLALKMDDKIFARLKNLTLDDYSVRDIAVRSKGLQLNMDAASQRWRVEADAIVATLSQVHSPEVTLKSIVAQAIAFSVTDEEGPVNISTRLKTSLQQPKIPGQAITLGDLHLSGPLVLVGDQLDFALQLNNAQQSLLALNGSYDLLTSNGKSSWAIPALVMSDDMPLHSLLGLETLPVWINKGELSAQGWLSWDKGLLATGTLQLRELGGVFEEYLFNGVAGEIILHSEGNNLRYSSFGKLGIAEVNVGVPVKDLSVSINGYSDDEVIHIRDFRAKLLDGELGLDSYQFDLNTDRHQGLLKLENLSLAEVMKVVDTPGLSGSGLMNGRLPFAIIGTDFTVSNGLLYSTPPGGLIKYEDTAMGDANIAMDYIYDALSNYHYRQMISTVDLTNQGKLLLGVSMQGYNPDFENGRSINLNLNLDDDIMQQMRSFNAIETVTEKVEKHYQ